MGLGLQIRPSCPTFPGAAGNHGWTSAGENGKNSGFFNTGASPLSVSLKKKGRRLPAQGYEWWEKMATLRS